MTSRARGICPAGWHRISSSASRDIFERQEGTKTATVIGHRWHVTSGGHILKSGQERSLQGAIREAEAALKAHVDAADISFEHAKAQGPKAVLEWLGLL